MGKISNKKPGIRKSVLDFLISGFAFFAEVILL
jgi:hypothetical protein